MIDYDNNRNSVTIDSEVIETVIGSKTRFKGSVATDKPIRIDGVYEGEIDSTALVVISESGSFNGQMKCRELQLKGSAEGTVVCEELLQLANTGRFSGDADTKDAIIIVGSVFDGSLRMSKKK